jgi:hypothetical protein
MLILYNKIKQNCRICPYDTHSGEVYSIQHYVIKFVSNFRHVSGFSPGTPVSSTNNTDRHDITEINIVGSGVKHHNPPTLNMIHLHKYFSLKKNSQFKC